MNKCEDLEGDAFHEGNAELEIYAKIAVIATRLTAAALLIAIPAR
jgi:hypothetical protein